MVPNGDAETRGPPPAARTAVAASSSEADEISPSEPMPGIYFQWMERTDARMGGPPGPGKQENRSTTPFQPLSVNRCADRSASAAVDGPQRPTV
jgi:hypothetical protein